jgi:hypothetical protein
MVCGYFARYVSVAHFAPDSLIISNIQNRHVSFQVLPTGHGGSEDRSGVVLQDTDTIQLIFMLQSVHIQVAIIDTPVLVPPLGFERHLFPGVCPLARHLEMIQFPVQSQDAPAGPWGELDAQLFERGTDAIFPDLWVDLQTLHFLHGLQCDFGRWLMRSMRLVFQPGELLLDPPLECGIDGLARGAQIACNRCGGPSLDMELDDGKLSLSRIGHFGKQREPTTCLLSSACDKFATITRSACDKSLLQFTVETGQGWMES